MRRKSKGQIYREEKLIKREEKAANYIYEDPFFKSLNVPQKMKLTKFITDKCFEETRLAEVNGYEKGMVDTMACVVQVLLENHWKKSGRKMLLPFCKEVQSLMDSQLRNTVTWEEMKDYIYQKTGMNMETDWMGKDDRPTPKSLFHL